MQKALMRMVWVGVVVGLGACGSVKAAGGAKVKSPAGGNAVGAGLGGGVNSSSPTEPAAEKCSDPVPLTESQLATCSNCIGTTCKAKFDVCRRKGNTSDSDPANDCTGVNEFGTREYCDTTCGNTPCSADKKIRLNGSDVDPCSNTVATCCLRLSNCLAVATTPEAAAACRTKAGELTTTRFLQAFKCLQDGGTCSGACDVPAVQNAGGSNSPSGGECPKFSSANSCTQCVCSHGFLATSAGTCESVFCGPGKAPTQASAGSDWACAAQ